MDKESIKIGSRLRTARELAGLSQGQVAKKLNMHRPTISEIEAGRRSVKANELKIFADLYSVDSSWLLDDGSGEENVNQDIVAAARELSSMKEEDIEKLFNVIKMIKSKRSPIE